MGDELGIVHLYGWFERPRSVVLDIRSYERIVNSKFVRVTLQATAFYKSIVFIGFGAGLDDPNFSRFRVWMGEVLSQVANRHYRLCRTDEAQRLAGSIERMPPFSKLSRLGQITPTWPRTCIHFRQRNQD